MSLEKSKIQTHVRNKFIDSPYIKNRVDQVGSTKYSEEEIIYWVEKIYNSNWSLDLFDTEFELTYKQNNAQSLSKIKETNDYIGQTFYIDPLLYPKGLFLSSICVFTAKEDLTNSLTLDVRPLINGIPSNIPLSGSITTIRPRAASTVGSVDQNAVTPWNFSDVNWGQYGGSSIREFVFKYPIYVTPGYYCFTLKTNSSNYSVYIAENGKGTLDSGKIVTNPYLGDFIYSGQGESWVIDPTRDLCFLILKAKFEVGTKKLYFDIGDFTEGTQFDYDALHLTTSTFEIPEISYISSAKAEVTEYGTNNINTIDVLSKNDVILPSHSITALSKGVSFTLDLTNKDQNLTPMVDMSRLGITLIKNYVDPYSEQISDSELTPNNGSAFAKYITKPVVLNEDFDADGITVYVDVNKPTGSSIEVFYRVLNRYDFSSPFDDTPWYRLPKKVVNTPTQLSSDYYEETYEKLSVDYVGANQQYYNTFNQLAIKIVFYADNPTKIPSIKNFRAIATV